MAMKQLYGRMREKSMVAVVVRKPGIEILAQQPPASGIECYNSAMSVE